MTRNAERSITVERFAAMAGVAPASLSPGLAEMIEAADLRYWIPQGPRRDEIILETLKWVLEGEFSVSGKHRLPDWERGWNENLERFERGGHRLEDLIPKFIRPRPLIRVDREYAETETADFEWRFFQLYRRWIFETFFKDAAAIYEFGCGPGHNFPPLAELYPDKPLFGLDWAEPAVRLVNRLAETHGLNLEGRRFDFFHPDEGFQIRPGGGVLTICALEQMGVHFEPFLDYLLRQRPAVCVHMEPAGEWYDPDHLVDYLALLYHRKRGYLSGFVPRLEALRDGGRIEIPHQTRPRFGSRFHEGYSLVVWRPV